MDDATEAALDTTGPDSACSSAGMRWRAQFQLMTGHKREVLEAKELYACEMAFRAALRQDLPAQTRARLVRGLSLTRFGQRRLDVIITKNITFSEAIAVEATAPTIGLYLAGEAWEDAPTATDADARRARVAMRADALDELINNKARAPPGGGGRGRGRGRGRGGRGRRGKRGKRGRGKGKGAAAKKTAAAKAAAALAAPQITATQKAKAAAVSLAVKNGGCAHCKALTPRPKNFLFHEEISCWKLHPDLAVGRGTKRK